MSDDVRSEYQFETEAEALAFVTKYERDEWARSGYAVAFAPETEGGPWIVRASRRHSCD